LRALGLILWIFDFGLDSNFVIGHSNFLSTCPGPCAKG